MTINIIIDLHVDTHDTACAWTRTNRFQKNKHTGNFCLVAPRNHILDRYEEAFTASWLNVRRLGKVDDKLALPGIRLATTHRVKGLEYDHMIADKVTLFRKPRP